MKKGTSSKIKDCTCGMTNNLNGISVLVLILDKIYDIKCSQLSESWYFNYYEAFNTVSHICSMVLPHNKYN